MIEYRGYIIEQGSFTDDGYTVFYDGDEVWFETEEDAMLFIDEVCIK